MTVQVHHQPVGPGGAGMEARGEAIANVTYTAPTETGEVETTLADTQAGRQALPDGMRVAANDPCPCGSGKKFQQCHGNSLELCAD